MPAVASALALVGFALLLTVAATTCDMSLGLTAVLALMPSACLGVAVATSGSNRAGGARLALAFLVVVLVTPAAVFVAGLVMLSHCPIFVL